MITVNQLKLIRKEASYGPLSFSLNSGEGLGIYGPNGIGKSTLMDTIANILPPKEGNIEIDGTLSYVLPIEGFQKQMTCLENFYIEGTLCGKSKKEVNQWLVDNSDWFDLTDVLNKKVKTLSTGTKVRLSFALSMLNNPDLLLMDESFNALDEWSISQLKELLILKKKQGLSLIFIAHTLSHFDGICENILRVPELTVESL